MDNIILKHIEYSAIHDVDKNSFLVFNSRNVYKSAYIVSRHGIIMSCSESKMFDRLKTFENEPEIVNVSFIFEDELLFILFVNGTILTYDLNNVDLLRHSLDVPTSICSAKFSHNQELLVLCCQNGEMLLFNKLLSLKFRYDMNRQEYGAHEMVNLNWGSKSTQFHGPGMRDHRKTKEEFIPLSAWDDSKSSIEWKHDDSLFIINFVCNKGYRLLKIFNREGILHHTSEYAPGLEKPIAWKPSGTLIAASQMMQNRHEIVFFEKNGLQHGRFCLRFKPNSFVITKLSWCHDSTLLLICGFRIDDDQKKIADDVLLYSQSNYHWYLKQKIQFPNSKSIEDVLWDECQHLRLNFLSSKGYFYHLYEKRKQVAHGNVLLIDGNQLKITDMNQAVIPPPLFSYSIKFGDDSQPQQIAHICFDGDQLAVFLAGDSVIIFKIESNAKQDFNKLDYSISYNFANVTDDFESVYMPIQQEKFLGLCNSLPVSESRIFDRERTFKNCEFCRLDQEMEFKYDPGKYADSLILLPDDKCLVLNSCQNHFYILDPKIEKVKGATIKDNANFYDGECSRMAIHQDLERKIAHAIVLTGNNSLYYDQTLLMKSNVNSFLVHNNQYLLFSTTDSRFYCWPLKDFDLPRLKQMYPARNLERGSEIVAVSNNHSRVVLLLPRGNLEAFCPPVLLLDRVNQCLQAGDFLGAFEIARKNRFNLNYICDYNMDMFIKHCDEFLDQLSKQHMDWINLFLFDLSGTNHYALLNHQPQVRMKNKLNIVCDTLLAAMKRRFDGGQATFLKPILLGHVKKEPPEIVEALNIVKNLNGAPEKDKAIKFLLLIVDIGRLLEEALGTYDFDIFLMVASRSNRDPKEYTALVERFKRIEEENYRRAQIDRHLQRYEKCLHHLSRCCCPGRFNEALELIADKHLFKSAIVIFGMNDPQRKTETTVKSIWNIYGDYLFKKGYYEDAGLAYKRAENYSQALKMYSMCSNWNAALVCARQTCAGGANSGDEQQDEFRKIVQSLLRNLVANQRYLDGAYLAEKYLENPLESFRILTKGHQWEAAIRCHRDHNLDEALIGQELEPELIDTCNGLIEASDEIKAQIEQHLARLKELKENCTGEFRPDAPEEVIDSYSETSSVCDSDSVNSYDSSTSRETLKTNRSSQRNRRAKKLEQKKYQLRRGSPNEDVQIIYALKELIGEKSAALFKDVPSVIKMAYELYYVEKSSALYENVHSMETAIDSAMEFVWNSGDFVRQLSDDALLRIEERLLNRPNWKMALPLL